MTASLLNEIVGDIWPILNKGHPGASDIPEVRNAVLEGIRLLAKSKIRNVSTLKIYGILRGTAAVDQLEQNV